MTTILRVLAALVLAFVSFGVAAQSTELSVDGEPLPFEAKGSKDFSFPGRLGEGVSIFVTGLAHVPRIESNSVMRILAPDGSMAGALGCRGEGEGGGLCKVHLAKLPASGRYTVRIITPGASAARGAIAVSSDLPCEIAARGATLLRGTHPGQVARCKFTARAGERLGMSIEVGEWPAGTREITLGMSQPGGQFLLMHVVQQVMLEKGIAPRALPASGTYIVDIDAGYGTLPPLSLSLTGR